MKKITESCVVAWRGVLAFHRDKRGAMMVTYALMLPVVLGFAGLGVETGIWYNSKRNVQTQADAAALSGAFERRRGNQAYSIVSASALREAVRNGFDSSTPNTIAVNNPPLTGSAAGDQSAVEVILMQRQDLLLTSLFMNQLEVVSRSVAQVQVTGNACVLALDPSVSAAIKNQGNPTLEMDGCVIAANSNDSAAISMGGSVDVDAHSLWTTGDISIGSNVNMTLADSPTVNAWPIPDPYASLTIPSFTGCDQTNAHYSNETTTINPGVYCGGIRFGSNSTVTLNPGTYYVDGDDVIFNASTVVRCNCAPGTDDGVTIVLTSSSSPSDIGTITINGGADVILNAPTGSSDHFKGILFYQDRLAPPGPTMKFNGGATMLLTGAVYTPNQEIQWAGGNSSAGPTCTQIVGRTVEFVGNSEIVNTGCVAAGVDPLEITGVEVVE